VKSLGTLSVIAHLPGPIARLSELAYNLWWIWNPHAQALYRDIDAGLWDSVSHNPVKFLRRVSQAQVERVAQDRAYLTRYTGVMDAFDAYMDPVRVWCQPPAGEPAVRTIAYFSAEFGLHESLPIYSGGLGILAGDHCKEASDLGLPFVGVGFLYPQGYFRQQIDANGRQEAIYEKLDFSEVPATPALDAAGREVTISVDLPGRTIYAKVWRIQVGRVPIFLMDTDLTRNAPADRELSARLYGGDVQMRISQEVVLGIGGVRALRALGYQPDAWHMNEGHAAFLQLERLREYVQEQKLPFAEALWAVRGNALFTTHTPVPAGNDAFNFDLMDRFFGDFWPKLGLDRERFLDLGRFQNPWGPQFSMTVLALGTAAYANGVSKLHGEVARRMWRSLWPDVPDAEIPIGHITNGVHTDTWLHPKLAALFDRHFDFGWRTAIDEPCTWAAVERIPDGELWTQHTQARKEMLEAVRGRTARQLTRTGAGPAEISVAARGLDPRALTIGFARRFATYKRATLIFRDAERLKRILNNPERPVQIIFAGKAHPADEPGKSFIQQIYQFSHQPGFAGRILFVEDYDANVARYLVSGVDLWLNSPRRPNEASGTSGQKAGLNGIPNFSVLDGWWCEGYDGTNGWIIGQDGDYPDEAAQDAADALSLYDTLENEIVPLFYDRGRDGIPAGWLAKMRAAIKTVAPVFSLDRTLKEYYNKYYFPASRYGQRVEASSAPRDLAEWEQRVRQGWPEVSLTASTALVGGQPAAAMPANGPATITATLRPGRLAPESLTVELVYGPERAGGRFQPSTETQIVPLRLAGGAGGEFTYAGEFGPIDRGAVTYGVRVRPQHPAMPAPFIVPLVKWA
jgi:starch phosphorylase